MAKARLLLVALLLAAASTAGDAASQLFTIGSVTMIRLPRAAAHWNVAYDRANDEYMMAAVSGNTHLIFQTISPAGVATRTPVETDASNLMEELPDIVASAEIAGGQFASGFMTVAARRPRFTDDNDMVHAWPIVTQSMSVGSQIPVSKSSLAAASPLIAYSRTSQRFLVVWKTCLSRFDCSGRKAQARLIGLDGKPIGPVNDLNGMDRPIAVVWNPLTNEFAVTIVTLPLDGSGGPAAFLRISDSGAVLSRSTGDFRGRLSVNTLTGHYIVLNGLSSGGAITGVEINRDGRIVSRGTVSTQPITGRGVAFNRVSGTFLVSGDNRLLELNGHGAPLSDPIPAPGCGGQVVSRDAFAEWRIWGVQGATSDREKCTIAIGTNTRNGGSETRLGGCTTADPFESSGGGFCENGGWVALGNEPSDVPQPVIRPSPTMTLTFKHQTTGDLAIWAMNGTTRLDALAVTPARVPDTRWQIVGSGDFNRDGQSDLLWQHLTDGFLAVWLMDGTTRLDVQYLTPNRFSDPAWRVRAVGDFNRDGHPDLVIQHTTMGWVGVWYMNGLNLIDGRLFSPGATEPAWEIVGAPDLNNDGSPDLVFQHTDGALAAWFMQNAVRTDVQFLTPNRVPHPSWKVRAVGDIDHDGHADLILQHTDTGELAAWLMNGITLIDGVLLSPSSTPSPLWKLAGPK